MMVAAVMMAAAHGLRQVLDIGKLTARGSVGEVGGKLIQLSGRAGVAVRLSGLRSTLQIRGDLLRDLLVFRGIGLLQLLERAQHLSER